MAVRFMSVEYIIRNVSNTFISFPFESASFLFHLIDSMPCSKIEWEIQEPMCTVIKKIMSKSTNQRFRLYLY